MTKYTRREILSLAGGGSGGIGGIGLAMVESSWASKRSGPKPPNIVFIFSDEHRWQSLSFTETPQLQTPNFAKFAREGISFDRAISNYPVCSPYRAILLTGRWPYQNGVTDNCAGDLALSSDEPTLTKLFQKNGYATGYIGKWHLGEHRTAVPFGFDFSRLWSGSANHWDARYFDQKGEPVQSSGYSPVLMTDQALEFIQTYRKQPFFLMVSWDTPHEDFTDAPEEYKQLYREGKLPYRQNADPTQAAVVSKKDFSERYAGYHGHISALDKEFGRILKKLKQLNLEENTIVVYTSDHGSMVGSNGLDGKRLPHAESVRVPFLLRWPGRVSKGTKSQIPLGVIDCMPTLCGLAGVTVPQSCQGKNYADVVLGKVQPATQSQFIMHIAKKNASKGENHPAPLFRGVVTEKYTYAVRADGPWLLFDDKKDSFQTQNKINDPEYGDVQKKLHQELRRMLKQAEDPFEVGE